MMAAMSRLRQIIFALIALVAVLAASEAAVRLGGNHPSRQYALLIHSHAGDVPLLTPVGEGVLRINPFAEPWFNRVRPSREKPRPDITRIVALGGSTVRGAGLDAAHAFPALVETKLASRAVCVETINLGGNGLTSYQLRWVEKSAIELRPDLVLIYAGHNDWTGSRLYGELARRPKSTRLRALLARSRSYLFLRAAVMKLRGISDGALRAPPGGRASREELLRVARRFETNIGRITKLLQQAGSRVVLCTAISDVLTGPTGTPFATAAQDQSPAARRQLLMDAAQRATWSEPPTMAVDMYAKGLRAWSEGEFAAAYPWLDTARDKDDMPLRAGKPFRDAMRRAAQGADGFVDLEAAYRARFVAGEDVLGLFLDNVHFSAAGGEWVAAQIAAALIAQNSVAAK